MASLAHYMERYNREHTSTPNKVCHGLGIPLVFAGIICLILMKWLLAAGLFAGGWVFLFAGHRIEGNHPAFFEGPVYLLVGPVWLAKELGIYLFRQGAKRETEKPEPRTR